MIRSVCFSLLLSAVMQSGVLMMQSGVLMMQSGVILMQSGVLLGAEQASVDFNQADETDLQQYTRIRQAESFSAIEPEYRAFVERAGDRLVQTGTGATTGSAGEWFVPLRCLFEDRICEDEEHLSVVRRREDTAVRSELMNLFRSPRLTAVERMTGIEDLLRKHPLSSYSPTLAGYLAEALFSQGDYEQAGRMFRRLLPADKQYNILPSYSPSAIVYAPEHEIAARILLAEIHTGLTQNVFQKKLQTFTDTYCSDDYGSGVYRSDGGTKLTGRMAGRTVDLVEFLVQAFEQQQESQRESINVQSSQNPAVLSTDKPTVSPAVSPAVSPTVLPAVLPNQLPKRYPTVTPTQIMLGDELLYEVPDAANVKEAPEESYQSTFVSEDDMFITRMGSSSSWINLHVQTPFEQKNRLVCLNESQGYSVRWEVPAPEINGLWAGCGVYDFGRLYIVHNSSGTVGRVSLYCLDASTGGILWSRFLAAGSVDVLDARIRSQQTQPKILGNGPIGKEVVVELGCQPDCKPCWGLVFHLDARTGNVNRVLKCSPAHQPAAQPE